MADKKKRLKGNEFSTTTSADGRLVPSVLATKPLAQPDKKPAPSWVKCASLPDCAEKNPEIIAGPTSDEDQTKSKATTKLDGGPASLLEAFSHHLDELDLDK